VACSSGHTAAVPFWYNGSVRRPPRLGLLALALAGVTVLAGPIVRDTTTPTSPAAAVLSGRAAPPAEPSGATGDQIPASSPAVTPPPVEPVGVTASDTPLSEMLATEARVGESWPTPPALLTGYQWPLPHGRVTNPFGPSWASDIVVHGVPFHDGLDIATFCGDHVLAAHSGIVIAAGRKVDPWMGWIGSLAPSVAHRDRRGTWGTLPIVIVVDDGDGYRALYAHFSQVVVHVGQRIRAGQFIGYEGMTGFATGCHVHFGLFDPLETATMRLAPAVAKRTNLPPLEIARIDPLLILPPR
jgi:murein DD-endopeptidase MepM/ murein hydrolase activator NlpD